MRVPETPPPDLGAGRGSRFAPTHGFALPAGRVFKKQESPGVRAGRGSLWPLSVASFSPEAPLAEIIQNKQRRFLKSRPDRLCEITGINISDAQIAEARALAPSCTFQVMNATKLDFPQQPF
jgi:hypothetical protein